MKDMYSLSDYLKDSINKDFVTGYMSATAYDRVQAFAAIRRAAELARESERRCLQSLCKGHGCLHDDDAYIVRRTIRIAIGSEKA